MEPGLMKVLKETMRIWPLSAVGTNRVFPHETELDGYHVPKGNKQGCFVAAWSAQCCNLYCLLS